MQRRRWKFVLLWAVALLLLLGIAVVKRAVEHRLLAARLAVEVEQLARWGFDHEQGLGLTRYAHDSWSGNWRNTLGPSIYLLERGFLNDELARALLFAEAGRLREEQYTYPESYNYDLRLHLIDRCLTAYPQDLNVAYAAGALHLAAGDDAPALKQLQRAMEHPAAALLGFEHLAEVHLAGRYCAALTLNGRLVAAEEVLRQRAPLSPDDAAAYATWLSESGRHTEVLDLLASPIGARIERTRADMLRAEAHLRSGDLGQFRTVPVHALRSRQGWVRLALAEGPGSPYAFPPTDDLDWTQAADIYTATGDQVWLEQMEERFNVAKQAPEGSEERLQLPVRAITLARAYVLTNRWTDAKSALDAIDSRVANEDRAYLALLLLTRLALQEPLESQLPHAEWWDEYYSDYFRGEEPGPFSQLRESDYLASLMRSPQFAAALGHGGTDLASILPLLQHVTRPGHSYYLDRSNGYLDLVDRVDIR